MKISQREARALRRRVSELEQLERDRRTRWCLKYPGGTHLGNIVGTRTPLDGRLEAARMLGHAVVCVPNGEGQIDFYALPLGGRT